jgi:HD-GYP domain-containing protein (c-di-GMP phosphodiesterase class II)
LQAIEELFENAGTQFDAELVTLFYKFLQMSLQI